MTLLLGGHFPQQTQASYAATFDGLSSMCDGRAGRVVGPLLTVKQHEDDPTLTHSEITKLRLLTLPLDHVMPHNGYVLSAVIPSVVIYSHA